MHLVDRRFFLFHLVEYIKAFVFVAYLCISPTPLICQQNSNYVFYYPSLGHRGYGSTEADKLSQEAIYCQLKALIPGKEKQANGDNDDQSSTPENTERGSEPSSPLSPGWGVAQQSPTFDLNSLQGEVEEGMLVNVSGGSGDELEELGCLELGDVSDNDELDEATDKITLTDACNIDVSTQAEDPGEDSCGNEEISKLAEKCNREFESVVDSNCNNKNDSTNSSDTNDTEVINKDIDP